MFEGKYVKKHKAWVRDKQMLDLRTVPADFFYHEREVWWTAIGVNIGVEIDGKNEGFERPVLVVRKINADQFFGIPLSSNKKIGRLRIPIKNTWCAGTLYLNQLRVLSTKRMLRKMGTLDRHSFVDVKMRLVNYLSEEWLDTREYESSRTPTQGRGSRRPKPRI
ncbi:MAG TPA: type II toxin-antitoxin system PemK/MazF family toxin [Candidatus Paceibacterota bacterium]|nr:type II toxin-antitoxin system PemK/MazF family toxin [Candidatus Paceibacterota bacterium]